MSGRWTLGVRREVLPNGLTLLVQPVPHATAVASLCHVRAGFFDEPDELTGVSHVLEHMLFKGTPTRGVGEIAREMKAAGGYLNAGTGYDHTVYYAVLPPESLGSAIELQADALRRSLIDAEELARELRVIIEEAKRKLDTASAVAGETLHAVLFDRHRIRRWRIGTEAQLAGITHADVAGYYRSRYVPSRTIVALVGALDAERALELGRRHYGDWPEAEPLLDPSPTEPAHHELRVRTLRGDVRQAELVLGWRSVPPLHPDAPALDVAGLILSAGRASWLYRALRAPGLVTSIGAGHFTPTEVGVFSVSAELDPTNLKAALQEIGRCLARLRESGPTEAELSRARTLLEARWSRRLQTAEGRASALSFAEALGGMELMDVEYERLIAVQPDEVRRAAEQWLRPGSAGAVAYLPESAAVGLEVEMLRDALRLGPAEPSPMATPPVRMTPHSVAVRGSTTGEVLHVALAGSDLLLLRNSGVPLVSLGVYRRRSARETPGSAGLGALAVRAAVRGAAGLDASALALGFERLGGSVAPLLAADWYGYSASVLSQHTLEAALLLDGVLRTPGLEPDEIARERVTLLEEAVQTADDMVRRPMQLALRGAFGDAGYGLPLHGLPESIPGLTDAMVGAWHAGELATGRTVCVAVGDLDPPRLAERLAGVFESTPASDALPDAAATGWRAQGSRLVEERAKRQTAFALLFPGPSRLLPARFAAEVWSAVASGLGGRLFSVLREQHSLAYTVFASSWQRRGAGALLLYLATSPERETEAREALLGELARFHEFPTDAREVARAVSYLSGQIPVERQTAGALAAELADAWLVGTGLDELLDPAAGYRAVTAGAIRELAATAFDPARCAEGVVRGR